MRTRAYVMLGLAMLLAVKTLRRDQREAIAGMAAA